MVAYDLVKIKEFANIPITNNNMNSKLQDYGRMAEDDFTNILGVHESNPLQDASDKEKRLVNRLAAAWYNYFKSAKKNMDEIKEIRKQMELYALNKHHQQTEETSNNMFAKTDSSIDGF